MSVDVTKQRGQFITFEGGEGAGKTTVIATIATRLKARGYAVLVTREPGGVRIAERIRDVLLDVSHGKMDGRTEALLYAAARRQHLVEKVEPALEAGQIVLCDRFLDSSLAYQGFARGLGIDDVETLNRFAIGSMMPTVTLWLDLEPELGLARIAANASRERNRLDQEQLAFHHRVRAGYRLLAERAPERIRLIDASQHLEDVVTACLNVLAERLEL